MRKFRFFLKHKLELGDVIITEQTAHYITNVLRLNTNTNIVLFDGSGYEFYATINAIGKNSVHAIITNKQLKFTESPLNTHLGQVISKGERMDLVMQKACELGVTQITPLFSTRCEVKLSGTRLAKKLAHWQQIIISAAEQCGRCVLPTLHNPQHLTDWLEQTKAEAKVILQPNGASLSTLKSIQSLALAIGSEGGFTNDEVLFAQKNNFVQIGLGNRILRTETAPITTLSIAQHLWGDI